MGSIRTDEYRHVLEDVLSTTQAKIQDALIVDSVNEWAKEHGQDERNRLSPRAARCFTLSDSGNWLIVLAAEITPRMPKSIRSGLQMRGFDITPIIDDRAFLVHLFLHELAHTLHPVATEDECDEWAFGHLQKYVV